MTKSHRLKRSKERANVGAPRSEESEVRDTMAFCIMHTQKQKGAGAVRGLQIEANREPNKYKFDRSDIDDSRTKDNIFLLKSDNWSREIDRQCREAGVKPRKDSVLMVTAIYTASPEFFKTHSHDEALAYFTDCLDFHNRTYGQAFNAVIHMDETTPHMHVTGVPIVHDEKGAHLSAKLLLGGRKDFRARQDAFYKEVGRGYGLKRGELMTPGEQKRRTEKREWQIAEQEKKLGKLVKERDKIKRKLNDDIEKTKYLLGFCMKHMNPISTMSKEKVKVSRAHYEELKEAVKELNTELDALKDNSTLTAQTLEEARQLKRSGEAVLQEKENKLNQMIKNQEEFIEIKAEERAVKTLQAVLSEDNQTPYKLDRMKDYMQSQGVWDGFEAKEAELMERTHSYSHGRSR